MEWINDFLEQKKNESLLRVLRPVEKAEGGRVIINGRELVNFSSNDYLGLAGHPAIVKNSAILQEEFGTSSSASRLMSGDIRIHHMLEEKVSEFLGRGDDREALREVTDRIMHSIADLVGICYEH